MRVPTICRRGKGELVERWLLRCIFTVAYKVAVLLRLKSWRMRLFAMSLTPGKRKVLAAVLVATPVAAMTLVAVRLKGRKPAEKGKAS